MGLFGRTKRPGRPERRGVRGRAAAPWYVIPAHKRWLRDLLVASLINAVAGRMGVAAGAVAAGKATGTSTAGR